MESYISISFCTADPREKIYINQVPNWKISTEKLGLFVVRSLAPLEGDFNLEILVNEEILWRSSIRPFPKKGLDHPFTEHDEYTYYYLTSNVIRSEDLVILQNEYDVVLYKNNELVQSHVLEVKIHEPETEDMDFSEEKINLNSTGELDEENEYNIEPSPETMDLDQAFHHFPTPESINEKNFIMNENNSLGQIAVVGILDEEHQEIDLDDDEWNKDEDASEEGAMEKIRKFTWNKETMVEMFSTLRPTQQLDISVKDLQQLEKVSNKNKFQYIIEKLDTSYVVVIHEENTRPLYLLIEEEPVHQWEDSVESYLMWLEGQISKMYNLSLEEIRVWNSLLIVSEEDLKKVNTENLTITSIISRKQAREMLGNHHPVIIDLEKGSLSIQLYFQREQKRVHVSIQGMEMDFEDKTQTQEQLHLWASTVKECLKPFGNIMPILLGYCSFSTMRGLLMENTNSSPYKFLSLAWELTDSFNRG